jgi:beta-glucanase (GH16 family)
MTTRRSAVCAVTVSVILASAAAQAQTIPAPTGKIWNATFINEFNSGASDLNGFSYDVGGGGWGNNERQVYTAPPGAPPATPNPNGGLGSYTTTPVGINSSNAFVSNGNLTIAAIATGTGAGQSYTSARLKTRYLFTQTYGLFEFRAKLATGQGLWPAVWMMSRDENYGGWPTSGEIDILESKGQDTGLVQGALHTGANPGAHITQTKTLQQSGMRPPGFTTTDWHTYSLRWTQGAPNVAATIQWYVDGINYYTQTGQWHIPAGVPSTNDDAPFDKPFYFLINMAVGGNYVGDPNIPAGTYNFQLDFLRAYSLALRPTWKNDQAGNWSDTTKWTDSISPNAIDADVLFGNIISQARTVTVDGPKTVGRLTFDDASPYTIAGNQVLTLDTSGAAAQINVLTGSHTISAPLSLAKSAVVTIGPAASTLTISNSLTSATGTTLTKTGPGTLQVKHLRGGGLSVEAGLLLVIPDGTSAATSKIESLSIAPAAILNLADNGLAVDYTGASPIDSIRALIQSGAASGTGLVSSAGALGYAEASDLVVSEFLGLPVDPTTVLVKSSFIGDSNLDGQVDITDLGNLATNWQSSGRWFQGDFNYDQFVDITDLGLLATNWQAGVSASITPAAGPWAFNDALRALDLPPTSVPEPVVAPLVALAGACLIRRR